jgi:hypothetical protein
MPMNKPAESPPRPLNPPQSSAAKRAGTLTHDEVFDLCGGIHLQAHDRPLYAIVTALTKIPSEVVKGLSAQCYLVVPSLQEMGSFTHQSVIGNRHLIAFPESLFELPVAEVEQTVLHEIAHFWLGHKPYLQASGGATKAAERQEREANELAATWLSLSSDPPAIA